MCARPGLGSFSILSSCKDLRPGMGTPGSRNHCPVVKDLPAYSRKWSSSAFLPRREDVPNLLGSGVCGMCARSGPGSFSILSSCKDRRPRLGALGSSLLCPDFKEFITSIHPEMVLFCICISSSKCSKFFRFWCLWYVCTFGSWFIQYTLVF